MSRFRGCFVVVARESISASADCWEQNVLDAADASAYDVKTVSIIPA